jgi:nucleoside-diphosphate-sugar epimerase
MRVLITGHLGYIGPTMVRIFKEAGHFVAGLDTCYFRECFDSESAVTPDIELTKDIRQVELQDLQGYDCIVHLAALSNDPMGELAPELTLQINYEASARTASLAKEAGVGRFIFASSCSLYGAADTTAPLTEEATLNPVSAYAVSKAKTEAALSNLADDNFTPVYLRNATAYGVSPGMRFDLVLNNLMGWARTSGRVRVMSDGTPWRPLVHIEDISLAALCAAQAPRELVHNQAFNVGRNDNNYRIKDIAEAVARSASSASLAITGDTAGDTRSYRVSFDKSLRTLPGFAPSWNIERGCEELNRWFSMRKETVDSFQSKQFVRLKQLKYLLAEKRIDNDLFWIPSSSAAETPV